LIPKAGIAHACNTSAAVTKILILVSTGKYNRLSTSKSLGEFFVKNSSDNK